MVSENEQLRLRRLVFYAADVDKINAALLSFVKKANAQCAVVIDKDGHLVAKQGFLAKLDSSALAALVAGAFASTKEVARLLGEQEFRELFHQGAEHSIHITLVGARTLQIAVFPKEVKAGMIQVLAKELANQLKTIFDAAADRPVDQAKADQESENIAQFSQAAKDQLDSLFGNL